MLDFLVWVVAAGRVVSRGLVVPEVAVLAVVQVLLGRHFLEVLVGRVACMEEAEVALGFTLAHLLVQEEKVLFVSSGPARHVHSHQQIRGIYK